MRRALWLLLPLWAVACEVGEQFTVRPANATHAAVCANCSVCEDDDRFFEAGACEGARDTVCAPCAAPCAAGQTFETVPCSPESDRTCAPCAPCASLELSACVPERDAVCGTRLTLRFESATPAAAFTRPMLAALAAAVATAGLALDREAVEPPDAAYSERRDARHTVRVDLRVRAVLTQAHIDAADWAAVARAAGVERLSVAIVWAAAPVIVILPLVPPPSADAAWNAGLTAAVVPPLLTLGVLCAAALRVFRRRRRVASAPTPFVV